jgi:hypothetical protein
LVSFARWLSLLAVAVCRHCRFSSVSPVTGSSLPLPSSPSFRLSVVVSLLTAGWLLARSLVVIVVVIVIAGSSLVIAGCHYCQFALFVIAGFVISLPLGELLAVSLLVAVGIDVDLVNTSVANPIYTTRSVSLIAWMRTRVQ